MSAEAPAVGGWKVLLVDDEPAVHEMSRLILDGLRFEGRGVELLSAGSAAQAQELLDRERDVALVLLDVVMETDDAGLALVRFIRERLRDCDIQIVLRTGQPGVAPEAEIVGCYEINGYVLKTEITAQRLQSIVIAALRGYRHARALRGAGRRGPPPPTPDPTQRALADELRRATEADCVRLQAQPEIELASNRATGIELVPHWKTALGLLPAARVGEALADDPARHRVVRWLLGQACFWGRAWQAAAGRPVAVSVPIVGDHLGDPETLTAIADAVRGAALTRGTLDLQIGEAVLLDRRPAVRHAVEAVRGLGVTLTLVDFGAGRISLQPLNRFVPDRLKIHRLFVRGVADDPGRTALARSLIALAQTLRIAAVADGIASDADAQFFRWEGCDYGQGDALAPACAPADVAEFLQHGRRAAH